MTIARAEMSTNLKSPESQGTVNKGMSVALIGPNDAHRQVVARALASAEGRKVHEFIDYPANLSDLARMMETKFDVVLVDVDTDESYALQIIAKLADFGPAVMAYSARSDQELLMSCMRAGAVDFLPLPSENGAAPEFVSQPAPAPSVQQVVPKAAAPKPAPAVAPAPPAARAIIKPVAPEQADEPVREVRPSDEHFTTPQPKSFEPPAAPSAPADNRQPEDEQDDFAAWDKANLRPATPIPITKNPTPRPTLVPDRRRSETTPRLEPEVEETPAPAPPIDRPPVSVELFRSSTFEQESEPNEAAEKQGAKVIKWILIGAGPVVLALVLLLVFTRPSTPNSAAPAVSVKETPAAPAEPKVAPGSQLIVNATGNNTTAASVIAKPSPATQASTPPQQEPTQVSPDAMAEQLVAPTRIAGAIKKAPQADEPPPSAPAPVSLDEGSSVAGSVFGSNSRQKVVPHVVPISAGVADGMIIHKTPPLYPRFAQEAHITGKVILKATITKQGTIEGLQVLSGPKILAPAAADAVKTWKYRPYMLDNQPVSVETTITVVFGEHGR
ncbi:MAG TPA: TonB family protein [Terracidiphilus sp.]|jgi:protein TonB